MSVTVQNIAVIDRLHYNGDPFWDGDQTLYELDLVDGHERDSVLVVVPRGDAFIPRLTVARHIECLGRSLADLRALTEIPGPGRRPQIAMPIEPR
jgi:hypothetical protein